MLQSALDSANRELVPGQVGTGARCAGTAARCTGTAARCAGTAARCTGTAARALLPPRAQSARRAQVVLDDLPALHHEGDGLEDADVGERVSADRDQVGVAPGLQRADVPRAPAEVRGRRPPAAGPSA